MRCLLLGAVCLALLGSAGVRGQEDDKVQSAAAQWLEERQEAFGSYALFLGDKRDRLVLESRPILNWSNPERQAAKGGAFLWTYNGRPQLIACAFMNKENVEHEFQSLATLPIVAEKNSRQMHRFEPGIEWKPLKDAPAPARPALRLSQFRRQAERFAVRFGANKKWTPTRLLTQPVFVSEDKSTMLFLFVQGTDPECTLLLTIEDDKTWQYALARQTSFGLQAVLDEAVVWERLPVWMPNPGKTYAVLKE
jgi:hypothetical protein